MLLFFDLAFRTVDNFSLVQTPPPPVWISILYTRIQCVRGGVWGSGPRTDNTWRKVPLQVNILDDDILHCLLWVIYFYDQDYVHYSFENPNVFLVEVALWVHANYSCLFNLRSWLLNCLAMDNWWSLAWFITYILIKCYECFLFVKKVAEWAFQLDLFKNEHNLVIFCKDSLFSQCTVCTYCTFVHGFKYGLMNYIDT